MRGQSAERFHDLLVRDGRGLLQRLALDHLRGHGAGGDSAAAAEGLKFHVLDLIVLDLEVHLHDVAAFCVADLADAVRVGDLADIARVHEVIHYGFRIKCHDRFLLTV